ncbi:MAG: Formamidase [bacterium ADurb.Bin429]|nr:MAG: Formamidase [bacterium ADurb.Bin429]
MNGALKLAMRTVLHWRTCPSLVTDALRGEDFHPAPSLEPGRVTVGLAQMRMDLVESAGDYARRACRLVRDAVEQGAQLIAFPEYTGLPLLGLLPGVKRLDRGEALEEALHELGGTSLGVADVFRLTAHAVARAYLETFSTLASGFRVYLAAGTLVTLGADGKLYNTAHLFGPDGALRGTQAKLHPFTDEAEWLATGEALRVFDLPFGKVAMPICMDYTYWETARLAWLKGAEILIDPSAGADGDREWRAARGVRMRVQESPCYGLHVYGVADLFSLRWRGPSRVVAPEPLLPDGARTLAVADAADRETVLVHTLDLKALREYRTEHPPTFNVGLYRRYLPELYDVFRRKQE